MYKIYKKSKLTDNLTVNTKDLTTDPQEYIKCFSYSEGTILIFESPEHNVTYVRSNGTWNELN